MITLLRNKNSCIVFLIDTFLVAVSFYLAFAIRFEFQISPSQMDIMVHILPFILIVKLITFALFRMYRGMWRYTSLVDLLAVFKAITVSSASIILVILVMYHFVGYPRSVFIIDCILTLIFIGGVRVGIRLYFTKDLSIKIFPALSQIRPRKKFLIVETGSVLGDVLLVTASLYLAYATRFEFQIPPGHLNGMIRVLPIVLLIKIGTFVFFRMYQGIWRFMGLIDLLKVVKAVIVSTVGIILMVLAVHRFEGYPRSVFFIDSGLTLLFVGGIRISMRLFFNGNALRELFPLLSNENPRKKKLLIIGAGSAGEKVLREILDNPGLKIIPVGFLDDTLGKLGRTIHGVKVLGTVDQIEVFQTLFDEILMAVPSATGDQMRRIVVACKKTGKRFRTIPSIGELIDGRVSVKTIRDVTFQDLLGREEVRLNKEEISGYLYGKRVLVTGAGGSIGSELVRQVSRFHPGALALVEMSEFNLFRIEMECRQRFADMETSCFLVNIRDWESLNRVFKEFLPQVVFHAAAYKHVPIQELHPWETVQNNVLGTRNLVQAARDHRIEKFVLVSTDKAVRPTNVMGATKRIAEQLTLGANGNFNSKFMVVRFGNVMGSSGSVIPTFQDQIARGGPVTVTHPEVTRYFMSIPEAAQLILEAGAMGAGGETFILDMGKPIRIAELARELIRLHGYEPDRDIDIQYIGLRPGEKLYEELITEGEGIVKTEHEKILVLRGNGQDWDTLQHQTETLLEIAHTYSMVKIKQKLQEIVPEYTPEL